MRDDRRRALGEFEPALGLIELARMRADDPAGEAEQPILRGDRAPGALQPVDHRGELALVDEERVVARDELDRGVEVAGGRGVAGRVDDQARVAVPARSRVDAEP